MKTTVELPDELVREVKQLAVEIGVTMRELVVEGLRSEIGRRRERVAPRPDFVFRTFDGGADGGLLDGLTMEQAITESYGDRC